MNRLLSAAGVPQIAGVFGDCIAGGGYMPIISDGVYMTEQAYMVIAGAALDQGREAPEDHLARHRRPRGPRAPVGLRRRARARRRRAARARPRRGRAAARLGARLLPLRRRAGAAALRRPRELAGLFPADHRVAYDARQVLARLVDRLLFWEVLPEVGREMICGVGRVGGLYAGFVANNPGPDRAPRARAASARPGGILYREGIAKISRSRAPATTTGSRWCGCRTSPGFDIGVEAEQQGLLGYGSSLIYTNARTRVPMFTVLLRKASGAGYYAMAGLPYEPVVQLSTPLARLAVMEGRTLAIAAYNTKLDDEFRDRRPRSTRRREEIGAGMRAVEARIEARHGSRARRRARWTPTRSSRLGELRGVARGRRSRWPTRRPATGGSRTRASGRCTT